jgi:hypothetical protein
MKRNGSHQTVGPFFFFRGCGSAPVFVYSYS